MPKPRHIHSPSDRVLDIFHILIRGGSEPDLETLATWADRLGDREVASTLRAFEKPHQPIKMMWPEVVERIQLAAQQRLRDLLSKYRLSRVALVAPLPPHVVEWFAPLPRVTLLLPEERDHLPPHLERLSARAPRGPRECRGALAGAELIVFEAYRKGDLYSVTPEVLELLDRGPVSGAALAIHLRPHPHHDDLPLELDGADAAFL